MGDLRRFAEEFFAAVDRHDFEAARSRIDPAATFSAPGVTGGREEGMGFMQVFVTAFPDVRHEILRCVEAPGEVALVLRATGTHTAPLATPQGTIPPTGRQMDVHAGNFWTVRDRLVTSYEVLFDIAGLMGQLGVGAQA